MLATWGDARFACSAADPHADLVLLPRELPETSRAAIIGNIRALACGEAHTILLDDLGNAYGFGRNRERQCGARFGAHLIDEPVLVTSLRGVFVTAIGAGWSSSYALSGAGELYAWGGLWRSLATKPRRVDMGNGIFKPSTRSRSMIAHSVSLYMRSADGNGRADAGGARQSDGAGDPAVDDELRDMLHGANAQGEADERGPVSPPPAPPPPRRAPTADAEASASSSDAEMPGGGGGSGEASPRPESLELHGRALRVPPFGMPAGPVALSVSGGYNFCAVVCAGGSVWTFGLNDRFQCGHGDRHAVDRPRRVEAFACARAAVRAVACGQQHSLALAEDGRVFSWGLGVFGALGSGDLRDRPLPAPVVVATGAQRDAALALGDGGGAALLSASMPCSAIACGSNHSVALTRCGEVLAWGHAEYAQTAAGDDGSRGESRRVFPLPTKVPRVSRAAAPPGDAAAGAAAEAGARVVGIACGHLQTALLLADGGVATFGWGTAAMLGHGNSRYVLAPTRVDALSGGHVRAIVMGARHAAALLVAPSGSHCRRARAQCARRQLLATGLLADCAFALREPDGVQSMGMSCSPGVEGARSGVRLFRAHVAVLQRAWPHLAAALALSQRFCGRAAGQPLQLGGVHAGAFGKALEFAYTGGIAKLRLPLLAPLLAIDRALRLHGLRAYAERWRARHLQGRADAIDARAHGGGWPHPRDGDGDGALSAARDGAGACGAGEGADPDDGCPEDGWLLECAAVFDEGEHADLELLISRSDDGTDSARGEVVLHAHRALLAAGSDYFKLLLAGHFADSVRGRIDLSHYGLEEGPARFALRFAYCPDGSTGGLRAPDGSDVEPPFAAEVLRASSAFCLDGLKQLAEATLVRHAAEAARAAEAGAHAEPAPGAPPRAPLADACEGGAAAAPTCAAVREWLRSLGKLADGHDAPRLSAACAALLARLAEPPPPPLTAASPAAQVASDGGGCGDGARGAH